MGRRTLLLLVAILIAALGAGLILTYVKGINDRAKQGQELVEVLVAADVIAQGESTESAQSAGKFDKREVRRADLVEGAVSSIDQIQDLEAMMEIYPGEQILAKKFGEVGSAPNLNVPDDKIAVSVELSDPDRVAGFVNAGAEVAVFFSSKVSQVNQDGTAVDRGDYVQLIIPRVQVIGVGTTTLTPVDKEDQPTEQVARTVVTLAVTQEEAEQLIFAQKFGTVTLGLLNEDSKSKVDFGAVLNDMIPEFLRRFGLR